MSEEKEDKEKKLKPKSVNFQFIPENKSVYKTARKIIKKYHKGLRKAHIGLVWRTSLKADRDGHLMLGKCVKVGDLAKEFIPYDFLILLNKEVWTRLDKKQQKALLDHELFHAAPAYDKHGTHKKDERGRYCFRTRRHQLEEFNAIVARHGAYLPDIEELEKIFLKRKGK